MGDTTAHETVNEHSSTTYQNPKHNNSQICEDKQLFFFVEWTEYIYMEKSQTDQ